MEKLLKPIRFTWNPIMLSFALLILTLLILAPLGLVFQLSFVQDQTFDWVKPLTALTQPNLLRTVGNSVMLGLWVVVVATFIALPVAFLTVKTSLHKARWLDIVLLIPFMTPPYINSMGWILFMQPRGYLSQLFPHLSGLSPYFFSFAGLVTVMSFHLFPFLYLVLKNTLLQIGANLEDAGAVGGGSFGYRLRRIILPLLISGYGAGALLVFVKTISEFGTPATFGRRIGFTVLTTEIHRYTSLWPINFGKAAILSSTLLGVCLLLWYLHQCLDQRFSFQLVGTKGSQIKIYAITSRGKLASYLYLAVIFTVAIGLPYFAIIATSLMKLKGYGLTAGNFTFEHYAAIFAWGSPGLKTLGSSLGLALATGCVAAALGVFLALTAANGQSVIHRGINFLSLLPNTVPGIVIIVGLVLFWNASWMPLKIYNTYWMVLLTYVVLFLPFTVQYVTVAYRRINPALFHAGSVCGGDSAYIFRRILFPLIVPGVLSGWVMTFIISIRELVASVMILPPGFENVARFIYAQFEQGNNSVGMAMAVITMLSSTLVLILLPNFTSNRK